MNQYMYNFISGNFYAQTDKQSRGAVLEVLSSYRISFHSCPSEISERSCSAIAVDFPVVRAYHAKTRPEFSVPLSTDHREFLMRP